MLLRIFAVSLVSSISSVTFATTDNDLLAIYSLSLEELTQIQVEVATKTKKSLTESPSTVSVISAKEIEMLGVENLQDLLNFIPGFQSYAEGWTNANAITARGRRAGTNNVEILVLYDGQRLNEDRSGNATAANAPFSLENIAQVEIIRGPGSAIYGSNAFTGIINLITKTDSNALKLYAGEQGTAGISANFSKALEHGNLSGFLKTFNHQSSDFAVQSFGVPTLSDKETSGNEIYVRYTSDTLNLKARYSTREIDGFYVIERIDDSFNGFDRTQYHLNGDYRWTLTGSLTLKLGGYYLHHQQSLYATLFPPGALAAISEPASSAPFHGRMLYIDSESALFGELNWKISTDSNALFALSHRRPESPEVRVANNFDLGMLVNNQLPINYYGELRPTTVIQAPQQRQITSLFAQYDSHLSERLLLTVGARYDDYSDFGSNINPRLGIVYKYNPTHTVRFSYGKAFRAPAPAETHLQNNPVLIGNLTLQPEQITTYELNWSQHYDAANLSLTLFDNKITEAVTQAPIDDSTLVQWQNGADYKNSGGELEALATLTEAVYLRASYTQFFNLPAESQRQSRQLLSLALNYQTGKWNFNLNGFYHSQMTYIYSITSTPVTLDGYGVVNAKLSYNWSEKSKLSITSLNLLDNDYLTPSATGLLPNGVINEGRKISVNFEYNF